MALAARAARSKPSCKPQKLWLYTVEYAYWPLRVVGFRFFPDDRDIPSDWELDRRKEEAMRKWIEMMLVLPLCGCGLGSHINDALEGVNGDKENGANTPAVISDPQVSFENLNLTYDLSIKHYESCDDLQNDIKSQLQKRLQNTKARDAYWKSRWEQQEDGVRKSQAHSAPASGDESIQSGPVYPSESITNVQEQGIDEADFVKASTHHIFVTKKSSLEVINRETLEEIGDLQLEELKDLTLYADQDKLVVLGVKEEQIEVCHETDKPSHCERVQALGLDSLLPSMEDGYSYPECEQNGRKRCFLDTVAKTSVSVYSLADGQLPQLQETKEISGAFDDSRYVDGKLVLIIPSFLSLSEEFLAKRCGKNYYCYDSYYRYYRGRPGGYAFDIAGTLTNGDGLSVEIDKEPLAVSEGKVSGVACENIGKPSIGDTDLRLTKVYSIDTRGDLSNISVAASVGGGDQIYMSNRAIYIAKRGLVWTPWTEQQVEDQNWWFSWNQNFDKTVITKVAFDQVSGAVGVSSIGMVEGRIKDEWAFKDYPEKDVLAVATTTAMKLTDDGGSGSWEDYNHLWLMREQDGTLEVYSSVNNFGRREDIRAIRYVGDMAYVVTYEKTDPLFAIDLSNIEEPTILSELKIPGFSMYLHPVGEGRMVGVGYAADEQDGFSWFQGIQVSLFDTSDPFDTSRLDQKVHGHRGSYSDVTGDHKAFFFDRATNQLAMPVVEKERDGGGSGWEHATRVTFSGAVVYKIVNDRFVETARLTHEDLVPATCTVDNSWHWWTNETRSLDINRVFALDGKWFSVSRWGIRVHSPDQPQTVLKSIAFNDDGIDCETNQWNWW